MKNLFFVFLIFICSCTSMNEVHESIEIMDNLVGNMQKNHNTVTDSYLEEIRGMKKVVEANAKAQMELLRQDEDLMQKIEILNEVEMIHENQKKMLSDIESKIEDRRSKLSEGSKNFKHYYKISDRLKEYLNVAEKVDPTKVLKRKSEEYIDNE